MSFVLIFLSSWPEGPFATDVFVSVLIGAPLACGAGPARVEHHPLALDVAGRARAAREEKVPARIGSAPPEPSNRSAHALLTTHPARDFARERAGRPEDRVPEYVRRDAAGSLV